MRKDIKSIRQPGMLCDPLYDARNRAMDKHEEIAWSITHELYLTCDEKIVKDVERRVAGALAACALAEAKWWHEWYGQDHSDSHIILERMGRNGCAVCQRIAALERAAEGKA